MHVSAINFLTDGLKLMVRDACAVQTADLQQWHRGYFGAKTIRSGKVTGSWKGDRRLVDGVEFQDVCT